MFLPTKYFFSFFLCKYCCMIKVRTALPTLLYWKRTWLDIFSTGDPIGKVMDALPADAKKGVFERESVLHMFSECVFCT